MKCMGAVRNDVVSQLICVLACSTLPFRTCLYAIPTKRSGVSFDCLSTPYDPQCYLTCLPPSTAKPCFPGRLMPRSARKSKCIPHEFPAMNCHDPSLTPRYYVYIFPPHQPHKLSTPQHLPSKVNLYLPPTWMPNSHPSSKRLLTPANSPASQHASSTPPATHSTTPPSASTTSPNPPPSTPPQHPS